MAISSTLERERSIPATPVVDVPAVFAIAGFAIADFSALTLVRGLMVGDLLILAAWALLMLEPYLPRVAGWYWAAASVFAVGTSLSLFPAASVTIGGWALHAYFYL